jgi:nitrite reductase (NADH) small subunit
MPELVRICSVSELPREGEVAEMADGRLCVARVGGEIVVLDGICPHDGGPLGQGMIEEGRVVCPYHGWAFDVKNGSALHDPNEKVRIFEHEVRNGEFLVRPPDHSR